MHIMMYPIPQIRCIRNYPSNRMYPDDYELEFDDTWEDEISDGYEDFTDYEGYYNPSDIDESEYSHIDMYREVGSQIPKRSFTLQEAIEIGRKLGINWETSPFTPEQFKTGLDVELEHGRRDPETNVTGDDPILTGKIALAHLREFPDYYERLKMVEE